jgi:hypothetical protein
LHSTAAFAESVADQKQRSLALVPNREREHASQLANSLSSELFVQVNQSISVAACLNSMPTRRQIVAQFAIVIDLAVEDGPDSPVFVRDRLAAREVNDAEPPNADSAPAGHVVTLLIRPALADYVAHRADLTKLRVPLVRELSGDAAHAL